MTNTTVDSLMFSPLKLTYSCFLYHFTCLLVSSLVIFSPNVLAQANVKSIELPTGEELHVTIYGKNKHSRLLWIDSGSGFHQRHQQVASVLAGNEMEVWQVNLVESLFLSAGAETMRNIPPRLIADLIEAVSEKGKYRVVLLSARYGSIPVIRGIHEWQMRKKKPARLSGAILLSPYFYTSIPTLGSAPLLIPELSATNIPVYIFQAEKNSNRWFLNNVLDDLQKHAPVYTEILKGVTSLFYREDTADETLKMLDDIVPRIQRAITRLEKHPAPASAIPLDIKNTIYKNSGLNITLTPYKGKTKPAAIKLKDVFGKELHIKNYKGKVTLINFWATWCPPCVEEIPSLNRLKKMMADKPFQLISINYAESPEQVQAFMKKISVDFPVLIDPEGQTSGEWKVVAFPSTFVIGPDGDIHYGVNAAIHWDTEQVINQLNELISQ